MLAQQDADLVLHADWIAEEVLAVDVRVGEVDDVAIEVANEAR